MNAEALDRSHRRKSLAARAVALAAGLLVCAALALMAPAARAEVAACTGQGSGAGQCSRPEGLATDLETGRLYVADRNNNRIDVFGGDGSFLFAFGWDVVASGPDRVAAPSEQDTVTLGANTTGGTFALNFAERRTTPIAFNAPASGSGSVEAALNALASIGGVGGSVTVSGSHGGPYTVTFGGAFAEEGVPDLGAVAEGLTVSGGTKTVSVATTVPGGAFEVCKAAAGDTCKAGSSGSGAGQLELPTQIAVDNTPGSVTRHRIYVVTRNNYRWQSFEPDGSFVRAVGWGVATGASALQSCTVGSGCRAGTPGPGACQLDTAGHESIVDPISIGPGGNVFIAAFSGIEPNDTDRVETFSPGGSCLGEAAPVGASGVLRSLAIDPGGNAYLVLNGELRKYELPTGAALCAPSPGVQTNALAIDEAGDLLASQREPRDGHFLGDAQMITEYSPSCNVVRHFGYGKIGSNLVGLAAHHSGAGDVWVSEEQGGEEHGGRGIRYLAFPPAGPLIFPSSVEASFIANDRVKIRAEVNPEGEEAHVHVEYVDQAHFEEAGFASPATRSSETKIMTGLSLKAAEIPIGCEEASEEAIEEGECLVPLTVYHYRVVVTGTGGEGEGPVAGQFETTRPLTAEVFTAEVGTDSATLKAVVNPLGVPASGYFEYIDQADFEQSGFATATRAPTTDLDFGSGEAPVTHGAQLLSLDPGTTYRYRLLAADALTDGSQVAAEGAFVTFQARISGSCPANDAYRTGPGALLPDCRAYEMVSPVDKENGDVVVLRQELTSLPAVLDQSATSGDAISYGSYRAFGDAASAPYTSQYLARREAGGWATEAISPPEEKLFANGFKFDFEYKAFSSDLCSGWLVPFAEPRLAPEAVLGYPNLYRRSNCGAATYETLTTAAATTHAPSYVLELQGISADGQTVAFGANGSLAGTSAPAQAEACVERGDGCREELYVKGATGKPRFVCVLPGGTASTAPCKAGTASNSQGFGKMRSANVTNALSADGSRLYWTNGAAAGAIYMRENPLGKGSECSGAASPCTIAVSKAAEEAAGGSSGSHFWAAGEDGSRAIFSTASGLYEFRRVGEATTKITGGFVGVLGTSADASAVYFASREALTGEAENEAGEKAQAGKPNLYLRTVGSPPRLTFIGVLSEADANPFPPRGGSSPIGAEPSGHDGRVSADGMHATFMSTAPLTGYDNTDPANEEADTEVFAFDAEANGGAGRLVCVSCNPSGERPTGTDVGPGGEPFWIAAQLPAYETTLYAPRVMSESGSRVFFESSEALVTEDTNELIDVYEWEEAGTGTCSAQAPTYSSAAYGCIDLISSGRSPRDSELIDASTSGDDVFFATLSSLYPGDPGLVDIYDARAGGGFPPPAEPPAACEGEACQPSPQAAPPLSPASAIFRGAGNVVEGPGPPSCKKGSHRVHRHGKTSCVATPRSGQRHQTRQHHRTHSARGRHRKGTNR